MTILFTRFPLESAYGGAEVQTITLMNGLVSRGHSVHFAGSCPVLLAACRENSIPHIDLDIGPPPVTKWGAVSWIWRRGKMKKKLQAMISDLPEKPDAICMLSLSEKLLLTDQALTQGAAVYWIEHDRIGRWLRRNPWLPRLLSLSRNVITICVSQLSAELYAHIGWRPDTVVTIPNGINLERWGSDQAIVSDRSATGQPLQIGCIARLTADKGVGLLVGSVQNNPAVSLAIIGQGPEEAVIMQQIQAAKCTITLQPTHNNLGDFYRSLDVLILPSVSHDPFGLVAAEAMSLGVPVIVTDQCGIAAYLKNGDNAEIIAAGDQAALKAAIERLQSTDYRRTLAQNGLKTARRLFSADTMINAYENLIRPA